MQQLRVLLGVELPIIQAPMAGAQSSRLALAVSNAGGLGSLPCALLSLDALRAELHAITAQTSKPFNVNFFCHTPPTPNEKKEVAWRTLLAPYYRELGLDIETIPAGPARSPFTAEAADILAEFKPPVVSFHFGLPAPELLQRVRTWGAKIISTATTVAEAEWLAARGVDAIIAQGLEAGGHRGHFLSNDLARQSNTLDLVRRMVQSLQIPVIAAGGIMDTKGVAEVMALGASGVQIGTAYLLCPEADTSAVHRAALQCTDARQTALTNLFTGRPARGISNRLMRELGAIHSAAPDFPLAAGAIAPLRAKAESQGSGDFSPLWAGAKAVACRPIPADELTSALAEYTSA